MNKSTVSNVYSSVMRYYYRFGRMDEILNEETKKYYQEQHDIKKESEKSNIEYYNKVNKLINGYYKNGYDLMHDLGIIDKAIEDIIEPETIDDFKVFYEDKIYELINLSEKRCKNIKNLETFTDYYIIDKYGLSEFKKFIDSFDDKFKPYLYNIYNLMFE